MVNTYSITPHQVNRSIVGNLIRKIGNRVLLENWPVVMILAAASDIMAFLPNQQLVSGGSACAQRVDFSNMNDRFDHVKDSGES